MASQNGGSAVRGKRKLTHLHIEAVAAMESEATVETLMSTIHAHPTLYEAMGEAFNAVYGLAINA